jgi:uncharacterized protein YjiS (DUF1127 family)
MTDPIVHKSANEPALKAALRPSDAMERNASASLKRDRHEQIDPFDNNHHGFGLLRRVPSQMSEVLRMWHARYTMRNELARLSERDLHDIGRSWSDIADEVDKPFWRA